MVWVVYGQTSGFDFVNYDDNAYVYDNPNVRNGITLHGVARAFTHAEVGHWAPLTMISHLLDCQFFGLRAGWHHLDNVLLHAIATILLFLALRQMTGALWRSAFVAAVFAVHPLHVESVAWVSERKDVLSGVFFMLAIAAYVRHTREPRSLPRYAAALLLFALGLMAKSVLVTLPFVLLLLDYWPLGRFAAQGALRRPSRLLLEKVPFFALSAAAGAVQMVEVRDFVTTGKTTFVSEIFNALVSCASFVGEMFYPAGLAASYADPGQPPAWKVALALAALTAISALAWKWRRKQPWLAVGWLWYLIMLAPPLIGFVQAGHAQSDRYSYLPQIGLYIAVAWMAADFCGKIPHRRAILGTAGSIAVAALTWRAWVQTSYWRNSETLWTHALAVTTNNAHAEYSLGLALANSGQVEAGVTHFRKALEIKPDYAEARYNLGFGLQQEGQLDAAIEQYTKALELAPAMLEARLNLGIVYRQKGENSKALDEFQTAAGIDPGSAKARNDLGLALVQNGELDAAIAQYQTALGINPGFAEARCNLGVALAKKGDAREAIAQYEKALELEPGFVEAQNNLAFLLATWPQEPFRNGAKALELAQQSNRLTGGNNPVMLGTLAAAYAETGDFAKAVETAQRAVDLAQARKNGALANLLQSHLKLYQAGAPLRVANP